jgi:peptide deformylase
MTILNILHFPDQRLRRRAEPVQHIDSTIHTLIDDMFATMYQAEGVGLAATQVNVLKRVVVIDVSSSADQPLVLVNPEILTRQGNQVEMSEGCLSVPGINEKVKRASVIQFRALNRDGELFEMEAEGLLAACVQHEIDHLDGKLFVDYLSGLKRQRIRQKVKKNNKV